MSVDVERLRDTLTQAEAAAVEAARRGEFDYALKIIFGTLREILAPLLESVGKLTASVEKLMLSLKMEREQRKSEPRAIRGEVRHISDRITFERWCARYDLEFTPLPPDPYRVDGVVEGKRLIALVEIGRGTERDVEQLVEGARIYEEREGKRPDALVLYVYAREPPGETVRICEEHGIIVDCSPKRIAHKLAEMDEKLSHG